MALDPACSGLDAPPRHAENVSSAFQKTAWIAALCLGLGLPSVAVADSVCGGLIPAGLLAGAGGFTAGCAHHDALKLGAAIGPDGNYIILGYPSCASGPCAGTDSSSISGIAC